MIIEGKPGPVTLSDGAIASVRLGRDGGVATQDAHARFQEAVYRGNVFMSSDQGTGGQMPAGLSASPITVSLYNPKGSNKLAVIWYASLTSKVAAAAAAVIWIAANTNIAAAAVTGTAATIINAQVGNTALSTVQALTTATLPAAPVAALTLGCLLTGAITTIPQVSPLGGFIDGALIMYPGSALSFQASTQGGAAGCHGSWIWEEIAL